MNAPYTHQIVPSRNQAGYRDSDSNYIVSVASNQASIQTSPIDAYGYPKPVQKLNRKPDLNEHGQLVCRHPDCIQSPPTFSRKCEWSKHMDKHERPYVCREPGCEMIMGFTYAGGLLRHEREVHRKHGGPRKPFMCPHSNCRRSTGAGFTRRENLNEHLRRVHQTRDSTDSTASTASSSKRSAEPEENRISKRSRSISGPSPSSAVATQFAKPYTTVTTTTVIDPYSNFRDVPPEQLTQHLVQSCYNLQTEVSQLKNQVRMLENSSHQARMLHSSKLAALRPSLSFSG